MDIKINRVGLITEGEYKGYYVKISPEDKGGHLILYSRTKQFGPGEDAFDHWILQDKLHQYFDEVKATIQWLE